MVDVVQQVSQDYLQYSVSTFNRALPDAIDGLKISQRRVIQTAFSLNLSSDKPYRKVAKLDGQTLGELHPHGSSEGTITQLGNGSEFLYPLMEIHGNAGGWIQTGEKYGQKLSDDKPAAGRYLECRLTKFSEKVFDLISGTRKSYDNQTDEIISYIPALPLALLNAQSGIGVGYATNSISFPLKNVVNALENLINRSGDEAKALGIPDFSFYSNLVKDTGLLEVHETGRGSIKTVATYSVGKEKYKSKALRDVITVTEIPEGSAESFVEKLGNLVESGRVDTVADIIDLSNGQGICVKIVLKANVNPDLALAQLPIQSTYSVNNTFVLEGVPKVLTPSQILDIWFKKRKQGLVLRFKIERDNLIKDLHIVEGLVVVLQDVKSLVDTIINSQNEKEANQKIRKKYNLSDTQAKAILDVSLKKLVKLSQAEVLNDKKTLLEKIKTLDGLINDNSVLEAYILSQAKNFLKEFGSDRRTKVLNEYNIVKTEKPSTSSGKTKRDVYLESTNLSDSLAKCLWKHHKKKTLGMGSSLELLSSNLDKTIRKIYNGKTDKSQILNFLKKYNLPEPSTRMLTSITKSQKSLEKYIVNSLNSRG